MLYCHWQTSLPENLDTVPCILYIFAKISVYIYIIYPWNVIKGASRSLCMCFYLQKGIFANIKSRRIKCGEFFKCHLQIWNTSAEYWIYFVGRHITCTHKKSHHFHAYITYTQGMSLAHTTLLSRLVDAVAGFGSSGFGDGVSGVGS